VLAHIALCGYGHHPKKNENDLWMTLPADVRKALKFVLADMWKMVLGCGLSTKST